MTSHDAATILVKLFEGTHNMSSMIGYCMKDFGKDHFQTETSNITPGEVQECRFAYGLVPNVFADRKEFNKQNVFKYVSNIYKQHLSPLPCEDLSRDCAFRFMLLSRLYFPSPG